MYYWLTVKSIDDDGIGLTLILLDFPVTRTSLASCHHDTGELPLFWQAECLEISPVDAEHQF